MDERTGVLGTSVGPRGLSWLWSVRLAAMTLALGVVGCTSSTPREPESARALSTDDADWTNYFAITPDTVVAYTAATVRVSDSVVLESARPLRNRGGLEILAARVNFIGRAPGRMSVNGYPGSLCTQWPVKGFGPTYDPNRLRLRPDNYIAFTFFVRVPERIAGSGRLGPLFDSADGQAMKRAADGTTEGLAVVYRQGDRKTRQTFRGRSSHYYVRKNKKDLPRHGACHADTPSIWTGTPNTGEKFVVRTPSATR